jgi:tryptophanyl-tRNA synthetase
MADTAEIDKILKASAAKVEALAEPVLRDVKKIVGYLN